MLLKAISAGFLAVACVPLLVSSASAAPNCLRDHEPFLLKGDTVVWDMAPPHGPECMQGLRWSYMQIFAVALVTPPKFGKVEILGSGFRYIPDPDAATHADTFKLHVLGKNRRDVGVSTIEISIASASQS
jgi:hypothetical protein